MQLKKWPFFYLRLIYLVLAVQGLHCLRAILCYGEWELLFIAVHGLLIAVCGLLIAVASVVANDGL